MTQATVENVLIEAAKSARALEAPRERIHSFDGMRAFAMFLVIAIHAAIPYMLPVIDAWQPDPNPAHHGYGYTLFLLVGQLASLPVFFFVSGFLARGSLIRRGTHGFVKERARHLMIPFAIVWPMMVIGAIFIASWPTDFSMGKRVLVACALLYHLWFLVYLMAICLLAVAWHRWIDRFVSETAKRRIDRAVAAIMSTPAAMIVVAIAVTFPLQRMATPFVDTPMTIMPNLPVLWYYAIYFTLGWLVARQPLLLDRIRRWRWAAYLVFVFMLCVIAQGHWPPKSVSHDWVARPLEGLWEASMMFGVAGFFLRNFSRPSRAVRFAGDASYWCYLMHLLVMLPLQKLTREWDLPAIAKYSMVLGATISILVGTYALIEVARGKVSVGGLRSRSGAT